MAYKGDRPDDKQRKDYVRHNEQIRVPQVLLIENGRNVGVVATSIALAKARSAGMDLVEVASQARPPVCQIMDYGKFMFDKQKKNKDKGGHCSKEKEITFRYTTDDHDLGVKASAARKFIEKGDKVRLVVRYEKREKIHKDKGFETLNRLIEMLSDVASVEKPAGFEGANLVARIQAKKGNKNDSEKD